MSLQCTQHGGDDYDKIFKGDPGIESIYNWTSSGPTVGWRGATGKGDGVHVLTGYLLRSSGLTITTSTKSTSISFAQHYNHTHALSSLTFAVTNCNVHGSAQSPALLLLQFAIRPE